MGRGLSRMLSDGHGLLFFLLGFGHGFIGLWILSEELGFIAPNRTYCRIHIRSTSLGLGTFF